MSNPAQREMPMLAEMPTPREIEESQVSLCKTERQAIAMCFNLSGHTLETIAERLEVNKGTLSKVVRGRAPLPLRVSRTAYMHACGNLLPMQWEAQQAGKLLVDRALIDAFQHRRAA